jgi:acyl-CoA-binding protein
MVSMTELQEVYTLDEMLKLYALYEMQLDIEKGRTDELERRS